MSATLVIHPPVAPVFAFRLDYEGGSVTISGDTKYSENLVELAAGTNLLLHEAIDLDWIYTFYPDDESGQASIDHHKKSHTPPDEAGRAAQEAGSQRLALHHLVPGNARDKVWDSARSTFDGELLIPRDNQRIKL